MFSNIIGHDRIKAQLQRDMKSQQFHQSYLFAGPEHVGKMALIREFMSLIRTGKAFDESSPFGSQVLSGQGPGLLSFLDDGESLKVDQMRKLVDFVSRRTGEGEWSFCVIEHVERMTLSAANAFLKVLEEPSERFIYFMTTREEQKLLPTIRSRVQLYRFSTLPSHLVEACLREHSVQEPLLEEVMRLSMGRIGFALSLVKDEELLDRSRELYDDAVMIFERDLVDRFVLADHLTKKEVSRAEQQQFLQYLAFEFQKAGQDRFLQQLDRIQELKQWFEDTQVNKRLQLEDFFASF